KKGVWKTRCGGSMIGDSVVLTAARCVVQDEAPFELYPNTSMYVFWNAETVTPWGSDERNAELFGIDKIIVHPDFFEDRTTLENDFHADIALLTVKKGANFSHVVTPIMIPDRFKWDDWEGPLELMGWGRTEIENNQNGNLYGYEAGLFPPDFCQELFETELPDEVYCIRANETQTGSCKEDIGGAVVVMHEQRTMLVGMLPVNGITDGQSETVKKYYFAAAIQRSYNGTWVTTCSGSIVSQNHILTSGRCVLDNEAVQTEKLVPNHLRVFVGTTFWPSEKPAGDVEEDEEEDNIIRPTPYIVARTIMHPDLLRNAPTGDVYNDVALLELERPIKFWMNALPISVAEPFSWENIEKPIIAIGWGSDGSAPDIGASPELRSMEANPIDPNTCQPTFPDMKFDETVFCFAGVEKKHGPCDGDFGGPVLLKMHSYWYQIGLVSNIEMNCSYRKQQPALAVDLSQFCDWLEPITNAPCRYAYSVALRRYIGNQWIHECMGSIMNQEWILTAGHCVAKENATREALSPDLFWIFAGADHLTPFGSPDRDVAIIKVASIHLHPDFYRNPGNAQGYANDIALVKLSRQLDYTMRRQQIRIPENFRAWDDPFLTLDIAGWGRLGKKKRMSEDLRMYQAKGRPLQECSIRGSLSGPSICYLSSRRYNAGPCHGDSGAAVATQYKSQWLQLGVNTRGRVDCDYSIFNHVYGVDATKHCAFYEQTIGKRMCIKLGKI
ncbi:unnamed protein product, partial [Mesorhabditis spiculigera]